MFPCCEVLAHSILLCQEHSLSVCLTWCGGLGENGPFCLTCLAAWSLIGGSVWRCGLVEGLLSLSLGVDFESPEIRPIPIVLALCLISEWSAFSVAMPLLNLHGLSPSETVNPIKLFLL